MKRLILVVLVLVTGCERTCQLGSKTKLCSSNGKEWACEMCIEHEDRYRGFSEDYDFVGSKHG